MSDHVHMLAGIPPKLAPASFMGCLKGKSAPMMRALHANLKHEFGNRRFQRPAASQGRCALSKAKGSALRRCPWPLAL